MTTENLPGRHPLPVPRGSFELADVNLVEDGRRLLTDLSVDVEAGSITYVLGGSSDERSALLRLLLGVEEPTSGSIRLDGVDLSELPLAESRGSITIALSDPWLTAGTIADNIAFGHTGVDRTQIMQAAKLACVDSFVTSLDLGLDAIVTEEAPELTVGQRRLVALARAVVRQPAVLLIEEPTRDLDPEEETLAIKALQRVARGRTTIVAARRLHYARRPNRLLRLERGRVVEDPAAPPDAPHAPSADWSDDRASRRLDPDQSAGALNLTQPTVEGYDLVRLLERSSYTETWLAWHSDSSKRVQLKLARRSPVTYAALEELSREYRTAESLRHPGLARPIRADFGRAAPFAVYEYVEGRTLAELIEAHGNELAPDLVLRVGYELARTLTYIHQRGYVHLDLRPEIAVVGAQGTIITDLKMVQSKGSKSKRIYRQDQYGVMAAEQLRGAAAATSMDLFTLGAVLYQAANGVLASRWAGTLDSHRKLCGPRRALAADQRAMALAPGDDAQTALNAIIDRLTAPDPDDRPTAEETLSLLRLQLHPAPNGRPARRGADTTVGNGRRPLTQGVAHRRAG
ncbi:MAG: ATP-binding cassette domain-containing protein [Actinomycetota bacterium]